MSSYAEAIVLYPAVDGATFDLDYYLTIHMPMVDKYWKDFGLKSWTVTKYGDKSPYSISCRTVWESLEARQQALEDPGTDKIMDDVIKFSSEKPITIAGRIVASK
jgi:uncharacterized protein (TIGR02118 family)